ncbi:MAG: MFS transporter, partial [Anaerolineae bacterium]|nr:MFS transporter [Anaerolineae bacterium]
MRRTIRIPKADYPQLTPLWIAVFIDILGFTILIPFLPFFSQEYGAPPWQIGLLLSTNALFGFVSGPIWGALSDARGRKPMLLISQVGTLIAFLMLAFSNNLTMLFISRVVDGIFGGNVPIAKAIVGDVVAPKDRSKEMSNIGVAHVLSSLLGPGLGGILSQWGIIAPGLFSAALTCLTIGLTILYLKESNPVARRSPSQQASNPEPGRRSLGKGYPAKGEASGLPSAGSPPAELPPAQESIWKNGTARYLLLQWGFHTLSFMLYISCISLFAHLKLGLNAAQVGRLLMIAGMVRVFIRFVIFIPLLNWLGDRKTSLVGLVTFVVVFPLLGFVENQVQ